MSLTFNRIYKTIIRPSFHLIEFNKLIVLFSCKFEKKIALFRLAFPCLPRLPLRIYEIRKIGREIQVGRSRMWNSMFDFGFGGSGLFRFLFRSFRLFRWFRSGCSGGFVPVVSGFSTCRFVQPNNTVINRS